MGSTIELKDSQACLIIDEGGVCEVRLPQMERYELVPDHVMLISMLVVLLKERNPSLIQLVQEKAGGV